MKNFTLILLSFLTIQLSAQDFYDLYTLQTIKITFAESNWDQLLDTEKAGNEGYTMAQSVAINGEVYDSVGVKYKGNSTYRANQIKNPFHIELDTYKDHDHQGYKDIKLSNVAKDPSFLREVLSYDILGNYMDAPKSNYANVYVNGSLMGLYSNCEAITKTFTKKRFGSKNGTFVKCNPPAGAGPQSNDFPNLVYLGEDSTDYYEAYEIKSEAGWDELLDLCDTLSNNTDAIEQILDVDRTLWMLAFDNVLVNLDSYIGAFAQNYYLYRNEYGQFVPLVWDLNESFGRFSMTGNGNLNSNSAKQQMNPLLQINDSDFPLLQKLLNVPSYQKKYIAHCKTMVEEVFASNAYYETGLILQELIDASVQADNNKFFSYNNFLTNLDSDITGGGGGPGGGGTIGIATLMNARTTYLLENSLFTAISPIISDISLSADNAVVGDMITISTSITDGNSAYIGYRINKFAPFTKVEMVSDGSGIFQVTIPVKAAYTEYYIYSENDNAGKFSPQRAEHEFYNFTATSVNTSIGDVVINEFMASNDMTQVDQDGEYDDWIELYNNSNLDIDLSGYFLSDISEDIMSWQIPAETVISANGYLMIWADKDEEQEGLHANFKLSSSAESIILSNSDGSILDEVSYADQTTDISYGRFPNGTGDLQVMNPTFGLENNNNILTLGDAFKNEKLIIYPNPTIEGFWINYNGVGQAHLSVSDLYGRVILSQSISTENWIDTKGWTSGIYLIRVNDSIGKIVVR
ncbi:CotH kinase family protein [Saprospiraceae bacterium]|nr:CotH kinase family protein [Saprospiraceae bacterium]MDA9332638.1 CotH kinase family protein [Saprospiraceae bacterium]MDA9358693.1 CotH kinase family protein [Saprospiraceae bacterium]MDA9866227.1 CotH kinase family protein [Saprospiraceae bacterium]MDC1305368.1 CotH kinase family protein [Saprospiraceae bacterium]